MEFHHACVPHGLIAWEANTRPLAIVAIASGDERELPMRGGLFQLSFDGGLALSALCCPRRYFGSAAQADKAVTRPRGVVVCEAIAVSGAADAA